MPLPKMEFMPFEYEGKAVRWVINEGEEQVVAQDVCRVLGIDDANQALERLKSHQKSMIRFTDEAGMPRRLLTVNEKGLYKLILTSRKPEAERFQDWITDEVLPTLRKTGRYELPRNRLLEHMERPVQIQHSKDAAAHFCAHTGVPGIRRWFGRSLKTATGFSKKELETIAVVSHMKAKQRSSGREIARVLWPEAAAAMSYGDDLVIHNVDEGKALALISKAKDLFHEALEAGYRPPELDSSPLEKRLDEPIE